MKVIHRHRTRLLEQVRFTKPLKVDRTNGIVYGVKILGVRSKNGYEYTREARSKAVRQRILEAAKVFCNHPNRDTPGKERDVEDALGRLFNIREEEDGIYGNLKYDTAHRMAESLANDAEQGTGCFALSLNADGDKRDGKVYEIYSPVRSVDLVTRPATTSSLSESDRSQTVATIKFKTLLESFGVDRRLPIKRRRKLLEYVEDKLDTTGTPIVRSWMEAEMDAPPGMDEGGGALAEGADHNEVLADGFHAACVALLQEVRNGDMKDEDFCRRIIEIMKAKSKLLKTGDEEPLEEDEEEDEEDSIPPDKGGGDMEKKMKMKESHRLKNENSSLKLLMESGVTNPSNMLVKAMSSLETDEERKQLLMETVGVNTGPTPGPGGNVYKGTPVRSQAPAAQRTGQRPVAAVNGTGGGSSQGQDWVTK